MLGLAMAATAAMAAPPCEREVPLFMDGYARDLRGGDRAAIAARYSAKGAYLLGFEAKARLTPAAIRARYSEGWQKPDAFEWRDLSVETLGPDRCLVTGGFAWTAGPRTVPLAYTAILVRERGGLRIALEHENPLVPPRP